MNKIKAFADIDSEDIIQCKRVGYTDLYIRTGLHMQRFTYSNNGGAGITLQQAQDMLKVLGIELYEEKEINTFEEFKEFLSLKKLTYLFDEDGDCFATLDDEGDLTSCWFDIVRAEKEYNVKLNILRSNE